MQMQTKKDFEIHAKKLTALVDFIKWTSSFSRNALAQMETPIAGVRLGSSMIDLFGIALDEQGWMLVMHEREGTWLSDLPVTAAYVGFSEGLILTTESMTLFDHTFPECGIDVYVPQFFLREELGKVNLLGFGLYREAGGRVDRVNRIVPLYNPASYAEARKNAIRTSSSSLFSQQR